jgi:hypothetical protein
MLIAMSGRRLRKKERRGKKIAAKKFNWFDNLAPAWKVIIFVLGLPGLYIGIISMLPRLGVLPQAELDPADPFSVPIQVSNDGYLTIHITDVRCSLDHVLTKDRSSFTDLWSARAGLPENYQFDLEPGGQAIHFCGFTVANTKLLEAFIHIEVDFTTAFLPWKLAKKFPFRGYADSNGTVRWLPGSPSK